MASHIRIGTRRSPLAQWQANWVSQALSEKGISSELVLIETRGDRMQHVGIPEIGSKGVFTEDLEHQLKAGAIDIAVHSAKDMPSELPEGFEIVAFTEREQAHDVVVSFRQDLSMEEPLTIGTSSTRRKAFLAHYHPQITTCDVRGNLQTRIGKVESGEMDAVVLAFAGVHRMEMDHLIKVDLPLKQFVPAVGQGSMAVEASKDLPADKRSLLTAVLNHRDTHMVISGERSFLRRLQGGCSIPAFAHGTLDSESLRIQGGLISLNGREKSEFIVEGHCRDAEALGHDLAGKVLAGGGKEILDEIRKQLNQ